jgi:hypothetical protein
MSGSFKTPSSSRRNVAAMPIDLDAAERFVPGERPGLDRHRFAVLLRGAPAAPVLDELSAYFVKFALDRVPDAAGRAP